MVNFTFEILGISGEEYEFKWVKITIYLDPTHYSEQIRLLIKVILEPIIDFSEPIHIYLQSNQKIKIKGDEILNKSGKIKNITYLEGIGTDKLVKKANVLEIERPKVHKYGKDNRISIKITPKEEMNSVLEKIEKIKEYQEKIKEYQEKIKEYQEKIKEYQEKIKEYQYIPETKFGFMIDTVIQNEGIEEEPFWKNLSGLSQFAWKFHFKVWSMMEDLEPIEPILTKSSERVQMFLVIPKTLFKSYGQIVAHPGEEAMHIMTVRDRNTFLLSEGNEEEKEREERKRRIEYWFEEGAMAISWEHGQTGSMSREAVVEHRQAYPRAWTLLTFVFLISVLGMIPLQQIFFPFKVEEFQHLGDFYFQWSAFLIILFVLCYFIVNIYNFSFYELSKITRTRLLNVFLGVSMFSLIMIFVSSSLFNQFTEALEKTGDPIIPALAIIVVTVVVCFLKERGEIKRGNIKIKEGKEILYPIIMTIVQTAAVIFAVILLILIFKFDSPILLFSYTYAVIIGLESGRYLIEGKF